MGYATKNNGREWRMVADQSDLLPGETYSDNMPPPVPEDAAAKARGLRDALLTACDWTMLTDAPLTDAQKSAWKKYRQDLRAVPQQSGFPGKITWPTTP